MPQAACQRRGLSQTARMAQVSVVMPFHQVTPFLRPAIRSILGQTLRDVELLLVDNGTGLPATELGADGRDPRLLLIRLHANLGVAGAHNAARAQATGEFIANMDSDDIAHPDRLARQVARLRAGPAVDLLATHAEIVNANGRVTGEQFTLATHREQREFSAYSLPVTNPTLVGRAAVFARHPMRGEFSICSDYDFFSRAIETHRGGCLPEPLLHYRVHGAQVTQREWPAMVFNACLIRLLTARRRAGRAEDAGGLLGEVASQHARPPPPAEAYAEFADRALAEGFGVLAVFLARRTIAAGRSARALARAGRVLVTAVGRAPAEASLLFRMFTMGPLRAHQLRPLSRPAGARAAG